MTVKILITGENSFLGTSVEKWLKQFGDRYKTDIISVVGDEWKKQSFKGYDVIFHVAAIVHRKAKPDMENLYYEINTKLPIEIAKKAKEDGVKQFIFPSTMNVFGISVGEINENSQLKPNTYYGKSKLQAEIGLTSLQSDTFKLVIMRPPMIYGNGSKGNYPRLSRFAQKSPIFSNFYNIRSILCIENFCEFVRLMIDNNEQGTFYPQNKEYISTKKIVQCIAKFHNKKIYMTKIFNPVIKLAIKHFDIFKKVFGSLTYDKKMSAYKNFGYCVVDFEQSIINAEKNNE